MVLTALVLDEGEAHGVAGIIETVDAFFAVALVPHRAQASIDRLVAAGAVLPSNGRFRPSEDAAARTLQKIEAGHELEQRVREGWLESPEVLATGLERDVIWTCPASLHGVGVPVARHPRDGTTRPEGAGAQLFRRSGIELYPTERKALLIAEYEAFVKAHRPHDPKPYENINHDVTVWLDVTFRGRHAPTSLETGSLFVTNDRLFRSFTAGLDSRHAPRVVMPAQLLQVLRPFAHRTVEDDERFVATLCLPEFRVAHTGYAATQQKFLAYLANYRDVDSETAVRILANEVVMRRVRDLDVDSDDFGQVLESQILRDNAELAERTKAAVDEVDRLRAETGAVLGGCAMGDRGIVRKWGRRCRHMVGPEGAPQAHRGVDLPTGTRPSPSPHR